VGVLEQLTHLVGKVRPSGKRLYPTRGGVTTTPASKVSQEGHGVQVVGRGSELVGGRPAAHDVKEEKQKDVEFARDERAAPKVDKRGGDEKLVFLTESRRAAESKTQGSEPRGEERSDRELAGEEENDDEEAIPFDKESFAAGATEQLGRPVELVLVPPKVLGSSLVGSTIAFHFPEGWDVGTVVKQVDPAKHKARYNYDVEYPDRGGTVFHRLQLDLYGIGDEHGAVLGSWVLLLTTDPPALEAPKAKTSVTKRAAGRPQRKTARSKKTGYSRNAT
jgi:hypothetical protein